jgi:hypothetical protein
MTADKRLTVNQIAGNRVTMVKEIIIEGLISFDIFDDKYFVVYSGKNTIEIYLIETYLTLTYRMRLPLYKDYENFSFRFFTPFAEFK